MIIRPTQALNARIKGAPLPALPLDANPFADWSAHVFTVDRVHYILFCNTRSFYSTVFPARGLTNQQRFVQHAMEALRDFMERDGLGAAHDRLIAPSSAEVQWAGSLNRSVTGSMRQLIYQTTYDIQRRFPIDELGFRINITPMSAIGDSRSPSYGVSERVFREMIDAAANP